MVSWFVSLGNFFFPFHNTFSLRSFFVFASTLTMMSWILILKRKQCAIRNIEYFLILLVLNPLLGPGSIVATPDVPLVLFWSLSYLYFLDVMEKRSSLAYSLLGVSLGLGFCSKYHIVIFVFSGLVYLIWSKEYKKLIPGKILLTFLFGFLFSLPVIYWNYQNDWASFHFQLKHGLGKTYYDWTWTAGFIVAQMFILNPFLVGPLFQKNSPRTDQVFGLSQIFFFLTSSFKAVVEANWPITSHLHSTSYVTQSMPEKKFKWALGYWVAMYLIFITIFLLPQAQVLLKNQINADHLDEIIPIVENYKPLYGPNYQISSLLTWITGTQIYKLKGLTRIDFFDSLPESMPKTRQFYVLKHITSWWPDHFPKIKTELLQSFEKQQLELYLVTYE